MAAKPEDYLKNEKWVKRIEGAFVLQDTNKNGYLSREEWFAVGKRLAEAVPHRPGELAAFHKVVDDFSNEFGMTEGIQLDKDQYIQMAAAFAAKQMNAVMKGEPSSVEKLDNALFDMVDRNHDGTISWEEYKTVMAASNIPEEAARAGFDMIDTNKNGKIEREEFTANNVKFWYNLEDPGDGLLGEHIA